MYKSVLTGREKEIFTLLTQNKTTKEIASTLDISEKTVRNHISNAMQKLGVKGRAGADGGRRGIPLRHRGRWREDRAQHIRVLAHAAERRGHQALAGTRREYGRQSG